MPPHLSIWPWQRNWRRNCCDISKHVLGDGTWGRDTKYYVWFGAASAEQDTYPCEQKNSYATGRLYHKKWPGQEACRMRVWTEWSNPYWGIYGINSQKYKCLTKEPTYLSPFCRSPTDKGCFMLWCPHTMALTPVAAAPFPPQLFASFTASWLLHVLFSSLGIISLYFFKCALKAFSSTKYTYPWFKLGSLSSSDTLRWRKRKFALTAMNSWYSHLFSLNHYSLVTHKEGQNFSYRFCNHPSSKLTFGSGHARQWSASLLGWVPLIWPSLCPRPKRFSACKWCHSRMIRRNAS